MPKTPPFVWLLAGGVLTAFSQGRAPLPVAAWLGPVFLLRFMRLTRPSLGLPLLGLVLFGAAGIANRGVLPLSALPYFAVMAAGAALSTLPYLTDRGLSSSSAGFLFTLAFPVTWVTVEFLTGRIALKATWGAAAYTQYGDLPLMQLASVTGIWGISFLIAWFGSVVNWAWDRNLEGVAVRAGLLGYAGVLSLVMLGGAARLALAPSDLKSVRVAVISWPSETVDAEQMMRVIHSPASDGLREGFRQGSARLQEWFVDNTRREARAGARIAVWPETNLLVLQQDETAFLQRAQALARDEGIYLLMGMGTVHLGESRPLENKAVLIDPWGQIAFSYRKSRPAPGGEADAMVPGDGRLPVCATSYGRVSAAICYDMDFPSLLRQAGQAGAELLLVPANDWALIKHLHFRMAVFRAVENGVSMVRATSSGVSGVVDPWGRTVALSDHFSPGVRVLIAQVPVAHAPTLYARVGNLFAWCCIVSLVIMAAWTILRARGVLPGRRAT
jgi:apolipoprotein N-acyltransferase